MMQDFFSSDWLTVDIILPIVFVGLLFGFGIYSWIRQRKLRKLKYEGTGMLKKTKIFNIGQMYHSGDEDSSGYTEYWLLSKDDSGTVYKSNSYRDLEHGGRTLLDMKRKYNGVEYDLTNKDIATRQVNDRISYLESEISNSPGMFKKIGLKNELSTMKEYLDIINEGPINPYVVIRKHKISVGDMIDVYVDPMNLNNYYFDLDFTKEKVY